VPAEKAQAGPFLAAPRTGLLAERSGDVRKHGYSRPSILSVVKMLIRKIKYEESNRNGQNYSHGLDYCRA
jgi:hypothetical protein